MQNLYQRFVTAQVPRLLGLSDAEAQQLDRLPCAVDDTAQKERIFLMLHGFSGPRDKLLQLLSWQSEMNTMHPDGTCDIDLCDYIPFECCEDIRTSWTRHRKHGWKAHVDSKRLAKENICAQVFPESMEIVLRDGVSDEPLPLTVAEEIFHIDALRMTTKNKLLLDRWIREGVGENKYAKEIASLGSVRYHWLGQIHLHELFNSITDDVLDKFRIFLIERDAMIKKLQLYRKLIRSHPEFKCTFWDELSTCEYPVARMSGLLNKLDRFSLPPKIVDSLGEHSLDELIEGLGGKSIQEINEAERESFEIPSKEEILKKTPGFLGKKPFTHEKGEDTFVRDCGEKMDEDEVEGLIQFLQLPWMADASRVEKRYAYERGLTTQEEKMLEVNKNREIALNILEAYDAKHQTTHALSARLHMLHILVPNEDAGFYADDVNSAVWNALDAREIDSDAVKKFFDALSASSIQERYLSSADSVNMFKKLLKKAKRLPACSQPNKDIVEKMCLKIIHKRTCVSATNRMQDGFRLIYRDEAKTIAEEAFKYFQAIESATIAASFEAIKKKLDS